MYLNRLDGYSIKWVIDMKEYYTCPYCDTEYPIIISEQQKKKHQEEKYQLYFQLHDNHSVFLEFDKDFEIVYYKTIPLVHNVLETIVNNNVKVSHIINKLHPHMEEKPIILFITNIRAFKQYFLKLIESYMQAEEQVVVKYSEEEMILDYNNYQMVITSEENIPKYLSKNKITEHSSFGNRKISVKSIILDTSSCNKDLILTNLNMKKIKINPKIRILVAFNNKKETIPPLEIREFFFSKVKSSSMELLNYQDTNGLNSIILQGYYNILEKPILGREAFEQLS